MFSFFKRSTEQADIVRFSQLLTDAEKELAGGGRGAALLAVALAHPVRVVHFEMTGQKKTPEEEVVAILSSYMSVAPAQLRRSAKAVGQLPPGMAAMMPWEALARGLSEATMLSAAYIQERSPHSEVHKDLLDRVAMLLVMACSTAGRLKPSDVA